MAKYEFDSHVWYRLNLIKYDILSIGLDFHRYKYLERFERFSMAGHSKKMREKRN
jgi:hypothetical protein